MVLISGTDTPIVEAIAGALEASGSEFRRAGPEELELGPLLRLTRGGSVELVLVERLARLRGAAGASDLDRIVEVAAAAGVGKLVLVTSRPTRDPSIVALRRSGLPYDIVRVGRLLEIDSDAVAQLLARPSVIAPAELIEATRGAALLGDVTEAVTRALARSSAGLTIEVEPADGDAGLLAHLQRLGVRPAVRGWRVTWSKLLARPALVIGASGNLELDRPRAVDEPAQAAASSWGAGGWL